MSIVQERKAVPPVAIVNILNGVWSAHVLKTALELDLFSAFKSDSVTAADMAREVSCPERGIVVLMDALVGLEILGKSQGRYYLTDAAKTYLVRSSALYMGDFVFWFDEINRRWSTLTESVRAGKAVYAEEGAKLEVFFPKLAASLYPMNCLTAEMVAEAMRVELLSPGAAVLDVGAGSGVWSIAMARRNDELQVDVVDFPSVLKVTTDFTTRMGVAGQFRQLSGDWREVSVKPNHYDVVILGHVLHGEGREGAESLINWCCKALKPGGRLVIAEFIPNEDRTGPAQPLLFQVNMFVGTENGCVFTESELKGMLRSQGFKASERLELPFWGKQSPVVIATK